jgi:hypothetical protein
VFPSKYFTIGKNTLRTQRYFYFRTLDSDDLEVESKLWDDEETSNHGTEWAEHNNQTTSYDEIYDFGWEDEIILNDTTLSPELDSETISSSETLPSEEEDETKWNYMTLSPESDSETISSSETLSSEEEDEIHDDRYRRDLLSKKSMSFTLVELMYIK